MYILYLGVVGKCRFYYYALVVGLDYATYFVAYYDYFTVLAEYQVVDGACKRLSVRCLCQR